VACSLTVKQFLLQHARSFVFTTAQPPCLAAALTVALDIVSGAEGGALREKLWANIRLLRALGRTNTASAIVPVVLGDEAAALSASARLRAQGFHVPAIRYPTVARGAARLRVTVSARHTPAQIEGLAKNIIAPW
jgi:7-keto-8-aminopelargonate synthetase-like enzyme